METIKRNLGNIFPYVGLILIMTVLGIASGGLLFSTYNISTIIRDATPLLIVSLGAVFIYSLGAMDISIGSVIGCAGIFAAMVMNVTGSMILGIVIAVVTTVVTAGFIGTVSIKFDMMPIMTSVCFMLIGRGVVTLITTIHGGSSYKVNLDMGIFKSTWMQIIVIIVMTVILTCIYKFTRIGKYAKVIGTNRICAQQNGIHLVKFFVLPFLILGVTVGIASIFVLSTTSSISRSTGTGFEMDVMIALILGGMPLAGGMKSKISSAVVGAFSYVILKNGLLLTSFISMDQVDMFKAAIFLVIIFITCRKKSKVLPI